MDNGRLLCWSCCELVPYTINSRQRVRIVGDRSYTYIEKYGECDICHKEIYVPGLFEENEVKFRSMVGD